VWQPSKEASETWRGTPVEKQPELAHQISPTEPVATAEPEPVQTSLVAVAEEPQIVVTMDHESGEGQVLTKDLPTLPDDKVWGVAVTDVTTGTATEIGVLGTGLAGTLSVTFSVNGTNLSTDGVVVYPRAVSLGTLTSLRSDSLDSFSAGASAITIVGTPAP
jgi:hypothetical protein